jgi:hypothetical protein
MFVIFITHVLSVDFAVNHVDINCVTINITPSTTAAGLRTRGRSLHAAVADELGLRIARGDFPAGSPLARGDS